MKTDCQERFDKKFGGIIKIELLKTNRKHFVSDRDELKAFISQELKRERIRMAKALRMEKLSKKKMCKELDKADKNWAHPIVRMAEMLGFNQAVKQFNQAIDNYLKERKK